MSHYVVGVIIEDGLNPEQVEARLKEVLAPFDENMSVPEYDKPCYCVGRRARDEARERADAELGSIDEHRKRFHEQPEWQRKFTDSTPPEEIKAFYERMDEAWQKFIKPRVDREQELFEAHELRNSPDPSCGFYDEDDIGQSWTPADAKVGEEKLDDDGSRMTTAYCYGSGTIKSTYNPKSKWDWWVVGGRWTGIFKPNYDPYDDPKNQQTCDICNGSGRREVPLLSTTDTPSPILSIIGISDKGTDEEMIVAINAENERRMALRGEDGLMKCNGCQGKGIRAVCPTQFQAVGNDISVPELIQMYEENPKFGLFAYLDGDGVWHEKGKMGWWAMVSDEKDEDSWREQQIAILNKFRKGYRVYAVDAHI